MRDDKFGQVLWANEIEIGRIRLRRLGGWRRVRTGEDIQESSAGHADRTYQFPSAGFLARHEKKALLRAESLRRAAELLRNLISISTSISSPPPFLIFPCSPRLQDMQVLFVIFDYSPLGAI